MYLMYICMCVCVCVYIYYVYIYRGYAIILPNKRKQQ